MDETTPLLLSPSPSSAARAAVVDQPKKAGGTPTRNIGLMAAVNIIIGVMIGSGIFVSPTAALRYSGSVGFCLIVWGACGLISLLGRLPIMDLH